ncbi:MAG TPA: EamA family transporter, partial [Pseudomonadales bacterium]|nr:EamA family transporter [Pseudomonadales bacterium]
MSLAAIFIVLLSALTHASWNLFGKSVSPSGAFFWHSTFWGSLLSVPVLLWYWDVLSLFTVNIWWLIVLSGLFQALYLSTLAAAYRHGDMSVVYPMARSSPLIILLIGTLFLGTADQITFLAVLGIVLIVGGCVILPMRYMRSFNRSNYINLATLFALLAALSTAGYSLVDDRATRQIRELPQLVIGSGEVALLFVILQAWSALIWLSIGVLCQSKERQLMSTLFANWRSTMAAGALILVTYALVVWAMAYADDVSYVVAFRQISIPIGVVLGWLFLKES